MPDSDQTPKAHEERRDPRVDLDGQYHKIGISAVAAAVRYQGVIKNTAHSRKEDDAASKSAA